MTWRLRSTNMTSRLEPARSWQLVELMRDGQVEQLTEVHSFIVMPERVVEQPMQVSLELIIPRIPSEANNSMIGWLSSSVYARMRSVCVTDRRTTKPRPI